MAPHGPRRLARVVMIGGLAAALLLVVALGYEAIAAARAQRRAVEGVLRDYAGLAAEQYARNVTVTFDYEWVLPSLRIIESGAAASRRDRDPAKVDADTRVAGQRAAYRLGDVALGFFALDGAGAADWIPVAGAGAQGATAGAAAVDVVADAVRQHAAADYGEGWPYATFLQGGDDDGTLVVYRRTGNPDRPFVGFVATVASLRAFLARAVDLYDLLPASLTRGAEDALVRVRVVDAAGATIFAHGPEGDPAVDARVDLDARRATLGVIASIPAASAARLVVGGLPYSRLPFVAALSVLTLALLVAGALLWRRERELIALREQFVAGASHELRTPLAQIRMFAETLRLGRVRSDEERDRSLEVVDREARRLSLLVENLLQFSAPSRRARPFAPEPLDPRQLVLDVVAGFEPLAAARGVHLDVAVDETADAPVVVPGDRDLLRQVLINLLDNAVKYGPDGQTVRVELRRDAGFARLVVSDQGPGVPAAERPLVWRRFWRGSRTDGVTGTGIGLALVREIVERHGGRVTVAEAPGGGARFDVWLPLARS